MAFFRWFVSVCFSFLFDTCYALATSVVCTVSYSHLLTLLFTLNILWQTSQHPLKGVATQNVLPLFTFGITDIHSVFHKQSPWSFLQKVQAWQFSHACHAVLRIMGSAWIWLNLILLASNNHVAFLMSHWKKNILHYECNNLQQLFVRAETFGLHAFRKIYCFIIALLLLL